MDELSMNEGPLTLPLASTCLVLVDIQYATGNPETGLGKHAAAQGKLEELRWRWDRISEKVVPNSLRMLEACRRLGVPRLFVTYGSEQADFGDLGRPLRRVCELSNNTVGQREHEIVDELKPLPDERVVNKLTVSAFNSTPIDRILRTYGSTDLLFCGVSTNACVEGTLRDAADRSYRCILVEDACGSSSEAAHQAGVDNVAGFLAKVASTDEVLSALKA
jgi:nicotinamidase-related amidase